MDTKTIEWKFEEEKDAYITSKYFHRLLINSKGGNGEEPGRHHLNQVKLKSSITRETDIMHLLMRCTEDTRSLLLHSAKNKTNHEQTTDKPKGGTHCKTTGPYSSKISKSFKTKGWVRS